MARELVIEGVRDDLGAVTGEVKVKIASDEERDVYVHADGIDVIQRVASAIGKSVSVGDPIGDADVRP